MESSHLGDAFKCPAEDARDYDRADFRTAYLPMGII